MNPLYHVPSIPDIPYLLYPLSHIRIITRVMGTASVLRKYKCEFKKVFSNVSIFEKN